MKILLFQMNDTSLHFFWKCPKKTRPCIISEFPINIFNIKYHRSRITHIHICICIYIAISFWYRPRLNFKSLIQLLVILFPFIHVEEKILLCVSWT